MRQKAILALKGLFEVEDFLPQLEPLTERCKVCTELNTVLSVGALIMTSWYLYVLKI